MAFKAELAEEINVLMQFTTDTTQQGIKVHHDARPDLIDATKRLFDKGLITQSDGGYLTPLGHEASEYAHNLLQLLRKPT